MAQRLSVGRLNEDDSVLVVKGFLGMFPAYKGLELYWERNELLSADEFSLIADEREQPVDISWSEPVIHYGLGWVTSQISEQTGLFEDLQRVYGERDGRDLFNLAVYKLDQAGSISLYEDWLSYNWLPQAAPLDSRRISELLAKVDPANMELYFVLRHNRAIAPSKKQPLGMTLSFDSTNISTYSETIQEAAYGKAR